MPSAFHRFPPFTAWLGLTDTGDTNEVVPLADKSCTLSIINRVVEYLKKHAEFEASNADDEVNFHLLCFPFLSSAWPTCHAGCRPAPAPARVLAASHQQTSACAGVSFPEVGTTSSPSIVLLAATVNFFIWFVEGRLPAPNPTESKGVHRGAKWHVSAGN